MTQQDVREQIAKEIEEYARKSYEGAGQTASVEILEIAEYMNTALLHAARIARGFTDDINDKSDWID